MFLIFGRLPLKMDFMYFVYFMCVEIMCTQGNMGEQPVAECFTLYKYTWNKKNYKKNQAVTQPCTRVLIAMARWSDPESGYM